LNTYEYTFLLNKPQAIKQKHTAGLEKIIGQFPYFQSARALLLKGLYLQDSFEYNPSLRKTAAYTTDRSVLFDFITSGNFAPIQKLFLEEKEAFIREIKVNAIEIVSAKPAEQIQEKPSLLREPSTVESVSMEISKQEIPENSQTIASITEKLNIGKPLAFSKNEKHSFQEWLQLANFKPIAREKTDNPNQEVTVKADGIDAEKQKKIAIIDRFIENNPKISAVKDASKIAYIPEHTADETSLMTETLAKVYLEQRKFQKAIQAYEILILKYPEKSSFFADRISDIKILQQNNN